MNKDIIGLFHSDVFIPSEVVTQCYDLQKCLLDVKYSEHMLNQCTDDNDFKHKLDKMKVRNIVLNLKRDVVKPFEIELAKFKNEIVISKFCIRTEYSDDKDISIVISPVWDSELKHFKAFIRTAWLNDRYDTHLTLNTDAYLKMHTYR